MKTNQDLTIVINAIDRASLDRQLDEAVEIARAKAMQERRQGILVTRRGYDLFTVGLSDTVPFGLTREQQQL